MTDFVSLGFALVTPHDLQGWEDRSVPPKFSTPSSCLCAVFPDSDLLGWKEGGEAQLTGLYTELGLEWSEGAALTQYLQGLLEARRWGFDSVFTERNEARAVARRWLGQVAELKLLGVELPANWLPQFRAVFVDSQGKALSYQGRAFAAQAERRESGGDVLGFEVLGVSPWGDGHTSACSNVRADFSSGFGAKFNEHGFLMTCRQAETAAREYMLEADGSTIENCDWFPIKVTEWPLAGDA